MLSSIGFTEIELLDKSRRRSSSTWGFLATWKDAKDAIQATFTDPSEDESFEVQAVKDSKCREDKRQMQQIRAPNRIAFDSAWNTGISNIEATKTRVVLLHEEKAQDEDEKKDAPMHDATVDSPTNGEETANKRPRLEPAQNPKDGDSQTWDLAGGTRIKNDGAGDCVFHAVAQGLTAHNPKKTRTHRQIRAYLTSILKKGLKQFEPRWDRTDQFGKVTKESFASYVDTLAKVGTWAGSFEFTILAETLGFRALVATNWDEIKEFNPEGEFTLKFFFDYRKAHYEFVSGGHDEEWISRKRVFEQSSQEVDPAKFDASKKMRGGGPKSIAPTDFASARCTTPATSGHKTRRSSKKPALTDFASTARPAKASKHATFTNEDQDLEGFDLSCETSTADQKNRGLTGHIPIDQIAPGVFRSECPWCPTVWETSTHRKLTRLRCDHLRRKHRVKHILFADGRVSPCRHQNLRKTNMMLSSGGSVLFVLLVTERSSLTKPRFTY